ncbi:sigma-70 family RNA polymerase sigma factor [Candidatus Vampirococcus lugosii]|uniref:RNA polymerase sigma factor n=1 Tax=Candidatus Vampirococcus lugosii TaxID=2789015 RepID=A0ABS5QN15_9BACT|nr:RNA polymerase sigma factor RpoD/SigA [Candidatus Vampirococcus lugosii]MBS8122557.1 rNA polymerase sigma factor [Candidatus Vampirococcus lugosii]
MVKQRIWDKLKDDINELSQDLQNLLSKGLDKGYITEDEIISKLNNIDEQIEIVEKFYDIAEKMSIKIETIEEILEREAREVIQNRKLGKVSLYETQYHVNDHQYKDFIKLYFNDISKIPLLKAQEEKDLANAIKEGDGEAKKKLMESNLRLVISIAKRFLGSRMSFMDLIQEGNIGLIKAIEKFDPTKDFKFSTYATWWIKQSITKSIADITKNVRIPVHLIDEINAFNRASQELFQKYGREPNVKEISKFLGFPYKKVKKLEEVIFGNISLDAEVGDDGKNSIGDLIADEKTLTPDDFVEKQTISSNLDKILDMLDEREAKIIKMRYGIEGPRYTLEQVGAEFNVTRERVRQIEQKVLQKLKDHEGLQKLLGIQDYIERIKFIENDAGLKSGKYQI